MNHIGKMLHLIYLCSFTKLVWKIRQIRFWMIFIMIISIGIFSACEKEEGEGGTSTIMGRVYAKNYNSDFTIKLGEYYVQGVDVYIIYGNDSIPADDFETSLDGWYRFEYLNKGTYTVYVMSDDPDRQSPSGKIAVSQTVTIQDNHSTVIVDDLVIYE